QRPHPRLPVRAPWLALPSRAVRPYASYSGIARRAWCPRSAPSNCHGRQRLRAQPRCHPRPSRCVLCQVTTCRLLRPIRRPLRPPLLRATRPPPPRSPARRAQKSGIPPSKNSPVGNYSHRTQADVEVGERYEEEAWPRPAHVAPIKAANAAVDLLSNRRLGQSVEISANQVPQRMATKRVARDQDHINGEDQGSDADSKDLPARSRIGKPHRVPNIVREDADEDQRQVEEIAMDILNDQREGALTPIVLTRLAHRAGRGIGPERFVVGPTVVVAGKTEPGGRPND